MQDDDQTRARVYLFARVADRFRHWDTDPSGMAASLRQHDAVAAAVVAEHSGRIFSTADEGFGASFGDPAAAVAAAEELRARLNVVDWGGPTIEVRAAVHAGESTARDNNLFGPAVNLTARLASIAHPSQVIVSSVVADQLDTELIDLGSHRLRGVELPVRVAQVGPGEFPPLDTVTGPVGLPIPLTPLVGRDDDVIAVRRLLDRHRLVSLTGPGGIGKTRIAIEIADQEARVTPDRHVCFVDLSGFEDGQSVAAGFASGCGLGPLPQSPAQSLRTLAVGVPLVVVDTCEHLIDDIAGLVDAFLASTPGAQVLTTTREALELDGEVVWPVRGLPTGVGRAASHLFVERALEAAPGMTIESVEDLETVARICERLDGAPLAIELAAAAAATQSLTEIEALLDDSTAALGPSPGPGPARHRTLDASVGWSYDLLDDDEQALLRALSVFDDRFDASEAAAVASVDEISALAGLDGLIAKSLVDRSFAEGGGSWFRLPEFTRRFAAERRRECG